MHLYAMIYFCCRTLVAHFAHTPKIGIFLPIQRPALISVKTSNTKRNGSEYEFHLTIIVDAEIEKQINTVDCFA